MRRLCSQARAHGVHQSASRHAWLQRATAAVPCRHQDPALAIVADAMRRAEHPAHAVHAHARFDGRDASSQLGKSYRPAGGPRSRDYRGCIAQGPPHCALRSWRRRKRGRGTGAGKGWERRGAQQVGLERATEIRSAAKSEFCLYRPLQASKLRSCWSKRVPPRRQERGSVTLQRRGGLTLQARAGCSTGACLGRPSRQ